MTAGHIAIDRFERLVQYTRSVIFYCVLTPHVFGWGVGADEVQFTKAFLTTVR